MDLIHPASKTELASALRVAGDEGRSVRLVGGRTHMDRTAPREVDAELWTTLLDDRVAYDPAEMLCVVDLKDTRRRTNGPKSLFFNQSAL